MEKLGVDERVNQETMEKRASKGCPIDGCGKELIKLGHILKCPVHGTEPFEAEGDPWQQGGSP